jgi:hypothetical protein
LVLLVGTPPEVGVVGVPEIALVGGLGVGAGGGGGAPVALDDGT